MAKKQKNGDTVERSLWKRVWQTKESYVMLAPFVILFTIFILIPLISAVGLSFTSFDMLQMPKFVGADNYIRLFLEDDVFIKAVQNTLVFAVITGPLGYILSLFIAWLVNELNRKLRVILTLIMYAPTLAGNVYYIWTFIFSGDAKGLVNSTLLKTGLLKDPIQWLTNGSYSFVVVIIVMIWLSLGTGFLSFVAGFQSLDKSYSEAAAIDGIKNRFQELWYVTLPQMVPQLLSGKTGRNPFEGNLYQAFTANRPW